MRLSSLVVAGLVLAPMALALACSSDPTPTLKGSGDAGTSVDARRPYPSFKDDVVPIVQATCALTACHSSKESNLGIFLAFDAAQIYGELQKTSPTAAGQKFVVPGDPAASYLMVKLNGTQAALAASCPNSSCGAEMPPGDKLPADKIEAVRKWIADGAKND